MDWGAWLAHSVEHVTSSQGCEFKLHIGCGDYLKIDLKKKITENLLEKKEEWTLPR